MSVEEQLIDLEIRLAYQSKTVATLDEVVREFAARVERLERQLAGIATAGADQHPIGGADEPPPHY